MTATPTAAGRTLVFPPWSPDDPFVSHDPIDVAATRYRPEKGYRLAELDHRNQPVEVKRAVTLLACTVGVGTVAVSCGAANLWEVAQPAAYVAMLLLIWSFAAAYRAVSAGQGAV